jgi:DNA polymerase-1
MVSVDTMTLHHVLYNQLPKDLATLASIYDPWYTYWKDEIEEINDTRWKYNGKDVNYTYNIAVTLLKLLSTMPASLQSFYKYQQEVSTGLAYTMMIEGIAVDINYKESLNDIFKSIIDAVVDRLQNVVGEAINISSPKQMQSLFSNILHMQLVVNRKSSNPTMNSNAMLVYLESYPEYRELIKLVMELKSLKVFHRTFICMQLDEDGRLRCSYNPSGTASYRYASRKNAFGTGGNLANLPKKGKLKLDIVSALLEEEELDSGIELIELEGQVKLPNIKKMLIPDYGNSIFDIDLASCDLHYVAYISDCKFLIAALEAGIDVYALLASHYYQREIAKTDKERQDFKLVCHGGNYGGEAPTLSATAGLSIRAVNVVLAWYFRTCPEIKSWQNEVVSNCRESGYITNVYGARLWVKTTDDRLDKTWKNKALALGPQSCTSIHINKGMWNLLQAEKLQPNPVKLNLQVHDSAVGQFKSSDTTAIDRINSYFNFPVTFPSGKIMNIPAAASVSEKSYGDCK